MKQRDPNWQAIRRHHVIADKRDELLAKEHQQEMSYGGRCPRCGSKDRVEVHGHTQCVGCHVVIDDCCQGGSCDF